MSWEWARRGARGEGQDACESEQEQVGAVNNSRVAARAVLLCTACVFINYIDRGNLATVAARLQDELGLTPTQLGLLGSAFFYSYVACMPAMGWLAEQFGATLDG